MNVGNECNCEWNCVVDLLHWQIALVYVEGIWIYYDTFRISKLRSSLMYFHYFT